MNVTDHKIYCLKQNMTAWSPAELATLLTSIGAMVTLLLKTLFAGARDSRCTSLCWGCVKRDVLPSDALTEIEDRGHAESTRVPRP